MFMDSGVGDPFRAKAHEDEQGVAGQEDPHIVYTDGVPGRSRKDSRKRGRNTKKARL